MSEVRLQPGEKRRMQLEFDKIYACFVNMVSTGAAQIKLGCIETDKVIRSYDMHFCGAGSYRGFQLESIGAYVMEAENLSSEEIILRPAIIATCYPASDPAVTVTDDEDLNLTLDVCRHTLKYCRQMIHLDSPKHSEPLACTGDYYIESLMTAMAFGDMELAKFDVVRTAELLRMHDGRMFHTSYSLIWVMMLWDVYQLTGDRALLEDCLDALYLLLKRFATYLGDNGLLETPPDFMFVDWIYIDEISMHHPPKALGQTCLCAFYHGALEAAEKIYTALAMHAEVQMCRQRAKAIRSAVNALLYDEEKGLYFDGLNTPTPENLLYQYMPRNVEKRYYMPHSNILCCCFGVCEGERARMLLKKVVEDKIWGACQPYFKHFLLEAVYRAGLRDEYTLTILDEWKQPVKDCPKGLVEGFIMPEPTYSFDHSHAWGGTPLYSLPKALLGLEILEPAYRKIRVSPSLMGLKKAHVEIPTPIGKIVFDMEEGEETAASIPEGIKVVW